MAALMGCLSISYDIRMALIGGMISLLYCLYIILVSNKKLAVTKYLAKSLALVGIIFVLLNCYWILPGVFSSSLMNNSIMQRQVFGDQFLSLLNAITLFHPFWTGSKPEWFVSQPIPIYLFVVPAFAFLGFLFHGRNRDVIFFASIALIGILLGKQSSEPFDQLYHFLFNVIPGFSGYREATKFDFMIALGYSVLVGALVAKLTEGYTSRHTRLLGYAACLVILCVCVWNSKPLITGEVGTMFVKRHVPDEYRKLKDFVLSDKQYSRALWIPTDTPWEVNNDTHPTLSLYSLVYGEWDGLAAPLVSSDISAADKIKAAFLQPHFHQLLSNSSIRYLIVPLRDTANDGDFYQYFGGSRSAFVHELGRHGFLNSLNANLTGATVFENVNYRPHCYVTNKLETILRDVKFQTVDFEVVGRSEYRVRLQNLTAPTYLNFTDNYNPQWQLHLGKVSWWDMIAGKSIKLPENAHTKNDAGLNTFFIDPSFIKTQYPNSFSTNTDGSINVEVTLYYRPQAFMVLGVIISLATLLGCLVFLLVNNYSAFISFIVNLRSNTQGKMK